MCSGSRIGRFQDGGSVVFWGSILELLYEGDERVTYGSLRPRFLGVGFPKLGGLHKTRTYWVSPQFLTAVISDLGVLVPLK